MARTEPEKRTGRSGGGGRAMSPPQKSVTAAYLIVAAGLVISMGLYDKFKEFVTRKPGTSGLTHDQIPGSSQAGPPVQGGDAGAQSSYMCPDYPGAHTYHICGPNEGPTPQHPGATQ